MDVNKIQLSTSHFHPLPNNAPLPMLLTPSWQPMKTTPPIPVSHGEGTPNIVAHPSPLQGRPSHQGGGWTTYSDFEGYVAATLCTAGPNNTPHGLPVGRCYYQHGAPLHTRPGHSLILLWQPLVVPSASWFYFLILFFQKMQKREVQAWRITGVTIVTHPPINGIMDVIGSIPMVLIGTPTIGIWPSWLGGVKQWSRIRLLSWW